MKSREISRSKIGPFSLAGTDPYIGIGWEYQSRRHKGKHKAKRSTLFQQMATKIILLIEVQE